MNIGPQCAVSFHYTLTDDAGAVVDSSRGGEPLAYLHGAGNIVPGLESALAGRAIGEQFRISIAPEQGYGARIEALVQRMPRSMFEGMPGPEIGMQFQAESNMGPVMVTVIEVDEDSVTLDGNHALAGATLHFEVEVVAVREASVEEVLHGHTHIAREHADSRWRQADDWVTELRRQVVR